MRQSFYPARGKGKLWFSERSRSAATPGEKTDVGRKREEILLTMKAEKEGMKTCGF